MNKKPNILMICSWISHDSNIGVFFREQALHVSSENNMFLVKFDKKTYGFRSAWKNKSFFEIQETITPENLTLFYVKVPEFWFLPKKINDKLVLVALNRFLSFLDKLQINLDLIHAQSLFYAGHWAYFLHKIKNTPYIITEHNQLSFGRNSISDYELTHDILRNSKTNCVVSLDKIRQFAANGFFYDFVNVGNSVDASIFNASNRSVSDTFNILTVGAYHPIKNQETILKALQLLNKFNQDKKYNIRFSWVGYNGWGEENSENVQALIKEFEVPNIDIELIDLASREIVASKMKGADAFIFSSLSEGMPVSVLEALACGTPVVTTNCGGVDELINDSNGKIVSILDFNSMFQFLVQIIIGNIKFNHQQISDTAIEGFGQQVFASKMNDLYRNVIKQQ